MTGLIYAFGNTNQSPFHKKFIAGGANDLRGWQAFKKPTGRLQNNTDTLFTGGIKLITSIEYRFNLIKKLKLLPSITKPEEIQTIVYSVGKESGYEKNLRDWFILIYEVLFGEKDGPRMGFFISFFGIQETINLINEKLK